MPMLAGVGLLMVCCSSSSVAATMMGGEEETPTTTTSTGPSTPDPDLEVFHIGGYTYGKNQAEAGCAEYDAELATDAQFTAAYDAGASWCSSGWLSDTDVGAYPINDEKDFRKGCGGKSAGIRRWNRTTGPERNKAGLNCYGVKPPEGTEKVARFNEDKWSRYD